MAKLTLSGVGKCFRQSVVKSTVGKSTVVKSFDSTRIPADPRDGDQPDWQQRWESTLSIIAGHEVTDSMIEQDSGDRCCWAVKHLSLTIQDGELMVLLGPSGSGKSTTLRLIAGLETCDRGQILLDDEPASSVAHQRNLALVFQEAALFPHLTVEGNIAFGLGSNQDVGVFDVLRRLFRPTPSATSQEERCGFETRVRQTARLLGLENHLDRRPHQLSGGERQRVALGRAIVRNPAAFLLDEPLASVDQWQRVQLRKEIRQLQKQTSTTMVYVTHDQSEAFALADRIALMNRGQLVQVGSPSQIYNHPKSTFAAQFLGDGQTNWMAITADRFHWVDPLINPETALETALGNNWAQTSGQPTHEGDWLVARRDDTCPGCRIPVRRNLQACVQQALQHQGCWLAVRTHALTSGQGLRSDGMAYDLIATVLSVRPDAGHWNIELGLSVDSAIGTWYWKCPIGQNCQRIAGHQDSQQDDGGTRFHPSNLTGPGPAGPPSVGDTIGLKFDPAQLHFFDLQTGQNLWKDLDETK